jgi:polyhydroxyalkanoate synthase
LQHLGVLIGRQAHARVWPEIIAWLNGHDQLQVLLMTEADF